ncbi:MAG: phosphodiesterase [Cyanobacteria bacterium J06623_5]
MIIAQISDLHVLAGDDRAYGIVDTNSLVAGAIAHINQLTPQPDCIVASGDLVHYGTLAEYQQLKTLLSALKVPVYLLPGNHDSRENMRKIFPEHTYWPTDSEYLHYIVKTPDVQMIMLDTIVPGEPHGEIDGPRLTWLQTQLEASPQLPTLIFMHHPPFITGIPMMDSIGLRGSDKLSQLIQQHPQVERITCGHLHRSIYRRWAGTVATTQPSLVHQVVLDMKTEFGGTFAMEPPAYQLHIWTHDSVVSHTVFVGPFDGPYPFILKD